MIISRKSQIQKGAFSMAGSFEKRPEQHICAALLAHVDAGKTTLSEALLYRTGAIRKLGRVDHRDAFLDTDSQERERGITIFSKQAELEYDGTTFMLLDTPGHVDFSAEMERTLQVLDIAILVISGKDGVQGHTATLWKLMEKYRLPVFIFVNKMDLDGTDRAAIMAELRRSLGSGCMEFDVQRDAAWQEQVAMCDEEMIEEFLENGSLDDGSIAAGIAKRRIFPCCFGSALKMQGVDELLEIVSQFSLQKIYPAQFGARVFKISRDRQGMRLTHMKITGGALNVKDAVVTAHADDGTDSGSDDSTEKIEQIRIYSGEKYRTADTIRAGDVCAVTGLKNTYAGQGLGYEQDTSGPLLESVLSYQVILPDDVDVHDALSRLRILEEEDPQLHVAWNEQLQEIQMQLMGEVQTEILKNIISERFGFDVEFGQGSIAYKETIAEPVYGAGHFEPLRHYAEVHLLMEPAKRGSGLTLDTACSSDELDTNWQRLILTHLAEKEHIGVLTGSPLTDMKITLTAGRAHLKHTEGGDFRQATYRALRQGLRKARSVLLEPWYEFRLEVPQEATGRAISDIQRMSGSISEPEHMGDTVVLTGKAPVSEMKDYAVDVASYTKGHGRLSCSLSGYDKCHDQERVIEAIGYDPDADLENTADSVFCSHGAGFNVKWDESDVLMNIQPERKDTKTLNGADSCAFTYERAGGMPETPHGGKNAEKRGRKKGLTEEEELERIFEMTYGKPKKRTVIPKREILPEHEKKKTKPAVVTEEYLLVDGYNIIFAWDELKALAKVNMDSARQALIEILANYQGYKKNTLILVFDAYKVEGGQGQVFKYHNIHVVFTKEAETADQYIEKTVHEIGRNHSVTVATSDALEQVIILGQGARRMSARMLKEEVEEAAKELRSSHLNRGKSGGSYLFDGLSEEDARAVEDARLGRRELFSDEIVEKGEKE